jgi:hypothetical protein
MGHCQQKISSGTKLNRRPGYPVPAFISGRGRNNPSKRLSCHYHRDMIVCVKPLPARMTAGLSCGIPGHGSSICPGLISGSLTKNTDSTTFPSDGGARPATHSWMLCGETMEPVNCPFCSPPSGEIVVKKYVLLCPLGPVSGVQRTYAGDPVPPCAGFF